MALRRLFKNYNTGANASLSSQVFSSHPLESSSMRSLIDLFIEAVLINTLCPALPQAPEAPASRTTEGAYISEGWGHVRGDK